MDFIELQKQLNTILKKSHVDSKLDYCLCCGKKVSSFCNSHSLPKFVLKNISSDGYVLTSNNYFKMPLVNITEGLNKSGTFKRICNDCDNSLFTSYESSEQLLSYPRKKMMTQIDLKNALRMYDKRLNEIALYNNIFSMDPNYFIQCQLFERQKINYLDLKEIKNEVQNDLEILSKTSPSSFELIFWEKLNYVTPIAFQGHIALVGDLNGSVINNIYNENENYVIENINICVFPLQKETIVMMFINRGYKKYKNFINQFKKLTKEKKLQLISYIIFNYSEDFFISKNAKDEILSNQNLDIVTQNVTNILALDEEMGNQIKKVKFNELMDYINFPNILGEQYSILEKEVINND